MVCEFHHDPLKVYCETCEELICRDCTISQCHQNHKHKLVTECYPDHYEEIEVNLTRVKEKVADINTAVMKLITREREVTKQGEDVKEQINTQAQLLINLIQESERQLVQQVDTKVQQKIQLLTKQREQAETVLNRLTGCEEFVKQSLKVGSQQQVLREKRNMIQVMTTVNQGVNAFVFQPIEEANITFNRNQALVGKCESIGELKSKPFGKSVLVKRSCHFGKKSTVTLSLQTHDESPISVPLSLISCELSSARDGQLNRCSIKNTQSGNYDISFTPHTAGTNQLIVQLGGVDIPGSPFRLYPEMRSKPVNIISGFKYPFGVIVTKNEDILVAERDSHCITILNKKGKKLRSFGRKGTNKGQFINPRGVAMSCDGHILVTDDHRLQKITFEGDCVKSVGSSETGNCPMQFSYPAGITVHPTTGQIFIADSWNHRIQILNNDLSYSHSFGTYDSYSHIEFSTSGSYTNSFSMYDSVPEQFCSPHDISFYSEGYLYVVDRNNHCIKKFTSTGQYISKFGSEGSSPGQLQYPHSIATYNNLVYVSEWSNHRVSIFDSNGSFIHCFGKKGSGEGEFNYPECITVDSLGNLYVSDSGNNRLVVV